MLSLIILRMQCPEILFGSGWSFVVGYSPFSTERVITSLPEVMVQPSVQCERDPGKNLEWVHIKLH